jgi:DNA repair ATPase RecN
MKPFECDGCVYYKSVGMDTNGKNKAYSCSNTDRRCYERLQFFNNMLTKLRELKDDVKADISELKRNPEMISECVGRLSTLSFILELFGEKVVETSNYQSK